MNLSRVLAASALLVPLALRVAKSPVAAVEAAQQESVMRAAPLATA